MPFKSKSCILDPLLVLLLKELVDILVNLITKIINKSLNTGIYPDKWKIGLVTPLLKQSGLEKVFPITDR